jgi:hypothetical protein
MSQYRRTCHTERRKSVNRVRKREHKCAHSGEWWPGLVGCFPGIKTSHLWPVVSCFQRNANSYNGRLWPFQPTFPRKIHLSHSQLSPFACFGFQEMMFKSMDVFYLFSEENQQSFYDFDSLQLLRTLLVNYRILVTAGDAVFGANRSVYTYLCLLITFHVKLVLQKEK